MRIELRTVSKSYTGVPAVDGLSLTVESGERLALLGPSGCGKTTTLRLIAGLETPDAGEIALGEKPASRLGRLLLPPHQRRIGMVFQGLALWPHLTARGHLAFGLRERKMRKRDREETIASYLEQVGLEGRLHRYPSQLSGGEKQRLAIARALSLEPQVLLLDEPLSSLDALLKQGILEVIDRLQRTLKITLIHVTHDPQEALALADRVLLLNRGKVEQVGSVEEVYPTLPEGLRAPASVPRLRRRP